MSVVYHLDGLRPCAQQQEALNGLIELLGENARVAVHDVDDEGFVTKVSVEAHIYRLPGNFAVIFDRVTCLTFTDSNNLTGLSPILGMRNLRDLVLERCDGAFALPTGLRDSTGLKKLYLYGCTNFDYSSLTCENLAGLELLQAHDDHYEQIPLEIIELVTVRKLSLNFDRVKSIPPLFENLQQLDQLRFLYSRQVESIALGTLVRVKNLELLDLKNLTELSVEAGGLSVLERICLVGCPELECLPAPLAELQNLRTVYLSRCYKLSIPDAEILECSDSLVEFINVGARHDRYTDAANRTHDLLQYMVCVNKAGRRLLKQQSMPSALWSHVLGRCSDDMDCLLFFLTKKPDLIPDLSED